MIVGGIEQAGSSNGLDFEKQLFVFKPSFANAGNPQVGIGGRLQAVPSMTDFYPAANKSNYYSGSLFTRASRNNANVNNNIGFYSESKSFYRGVNSDTRSGFDFKSRFCIVMNTSTSNRLFAGLASTNSIIDNPIAVNSTIGFFVETEGTTFRFGSKNSGSNVSSVDTGLPYIVGNSYEVSFRTADDANSVSWKITDLDTYEFVEGVFDTVMHLPNAQNNIGACVMMNSGTDTTTANQQIAIEYIIVQSVF